MEIRLATEESLLDIMYLLYTCVRNMNRNGMFQWNQAYPSHEIIAKDIEDKSLYILEDNRVIKGIIVLNESQPDEYRKIEWRFEDSDRPALMVHRLAVHPLFHNQGVGKKLMEYALEYASKNEYSIIRLDVFGQNPSANKLYNKLGFLKAGKFRFPFQETEFVCYEMKI